MHAPPTPRRPSQLELLCRRLEVRQTLIADQGEVRTTPDTDCRMAAHLLRAFGKQGDPLRMFVWGIMLGIVAMPLAFGFVLWAGGVGIQLVQRW